MFPLWLFPSGFRKIRHAQRHHREDLQKMQERVSRFSLREPSWILGEFVRAHESMAQFVGPDRAALQGSSGRQTGWVGYGMR